MYGRLRWKLQRLRARAPSWLYRILMEVARATSNRASRHELPGELIVSLTSYPARYPLLHLTLKCLLRQDIRADRVVLWIARGDIVKLPKRVLRLQGLGLEIAATEDTRSFKKIVPALRRFPNAVIVTADDDVYYPRDWLRSLVQEYSSRAPAIVCHRGHLPTFTASGDTCPYGNWQWEARCPEGSNILMPTGVGGVLYPPNSLDSRVLDENLFSSLCPYADDLWLYFMGRLRGAHYRTVPTIFRLREWTSSHGLSGENVSKGRNDQQVARLEAHFGRIHDLGMR